MSLATLCKIWNSFWFEPQSPASICMFRIAYGVLLMISTLLLIPGASDYFGPDALVSEKSVDIYHGTGHFSLLFLAPRDDLFVYLVLFALLLASVGLTIGLFTRTSALVSFICLVSLHHRDPVILNGGDTLLRILAFILILSPAGMMYSCDASAKKSEVVKPPLAAPWAMRLIQIQIVGLYCQAFWCKAVGIDWVDGSAVFYATHLPEYMRLPVPYLIDTEWTVRLLTWGALFIEFALWALIWIKEFRYWVLLAGVGLHLGIEWSMNIPLFEWIILSTYFCFVEPEKIEYMVATVKSLAARKTVAVALPHAVIRK